MWRRVLLSILGCKFFPFITLNVSCHSLLACRVSIEKSVDSLAGVPLYVICHFILLLIFYLSLIFLSLITMFLRMFLLPGTLCFLDLVDYLLSCVQEVFRYSSSNIFSGPFSLSSPSGTPIMWMLMCLMLFQRSLRLSSFLFILASIFCSEAVGFPPFHPLGHLSILLPLLFCYWFLLVY